MKKSIFLVLVLIFSSVSAFSQSFYDWKRDRQWSLVVSGGFSSYYGDLNDPGDIFDLGGNFNAGVQYAFKDHINFRAQFGYIRLSGSDLDIDPELSTKSRNLSFRANNYDINGLAIIELFPRSGSYYRRAPINPYAIAGIGLMFSNPKAKALSDGKYHKLRPLKTEGKSYSSVVTTIPFGMGVNLYLNRFFNAGIEGIYRLTFSDYIDDVSDVYIDNASFTDPIAAELADRRQDLGLAPVPAGTKRGNPDKNDGYFTLALKIEYYIPTDMIKKNRRRKANKRVRSKRYKRRR